MTLQGKESPVNKFQAAHNRFHLNVLQHIVDFWVCNMLQYLVARYSLPGNAKNPSHQQYHNHNEI